MQQLRALRVRGVAQDRARLRPRDEGARGGGERDVVGRGRRQAEGGGEGRDVAAVRGADERRRRGGAADPARVLGEEGVEPGQSLLAEDEVEGVEDGVLESCVSGCTVLRCTGVCWVGGRGGWVERQREAKTHIVVGVGQHELVLELGLEEVLVLLRPVGHVAAVPDVGPAEDADAGVVALLVLVLVVDLVPAERLVGQQRALRLPARVVVQGLQDDAVDVQAVGGELAVDLQRTGC